MPLSPGHIGPWIQKNPAQAALIGAVALSLLFVMGMLIMQVRAGERSSEDPLVNEEKNEPIKLPTPEEFKTISLVGESAFVWDVREKRVIFEKNQHDKKPLASITKVMTVLTAADHLEDNALVVISARSLSTEGQSGFVEGEAVPFDDLGAFTLVASSNDAAEAIAEATSREAGTPFPELMNKKARELNLHTLSFKNASGLDVDEYRGESGSIGSARDVALLFDYMLREKLPLIEATREPVIAIRSGGGLLHQADNTNILSSELPGLIGSKTGYTTLAGGNLVAAFDVGIAHPIVIVVLGSTQEARFSDVEALYNATKAYITREAQQSTKTL